MNSLELEAAEENHGITSRGLDLHVSFLKRDVQMFETNVDGVKIAVKFHLSSIQQAQKCVQISFEKTRTCFWENRLVCSQKVLRPAQSWSR